MQNKRENWTYEDYLERYSYYDDNQIDQGKRVAIVATIVFSLMGLLLISHALFGNDSVYWDVAGWLATIIFGASLVASIAPFLNNEYNKSRCLEGMRECSKKKLFRKNE